MDEGKAFGFGLFEVTKGIEPVILDSDISVDGGEDPHDSSFRPPRCSSGYAFRPSEEGAMY